MNDREMMWMIQSVLRIFLGKNRSDKKISTITAKGTIRCKQESYLTVAKGNKGIKPEDLS